MPNSLNWFHRADGMQMSGSPNQSRSLPSRSATTWSQRQRDANVPNTNFVLNQKNIYERRLPGGSYITAHVIRLQKGFFDSPVLHEDCINNVRFVAIRFVFHPIDNTHRFTAARIAISLQPKLEEPPPMMPLPPQIARKSITSDEEKLKAKPRFLRHAPHLLYGALSPETLDWNFNLAGSLGVSQMGANASLNPSGGVKSSYKLFKMMRVQGSIRTLSSWYGSDFEVEDGELVWTLEENELQRSGLPREFTFVMLLTKGHESNKVDFNLNIEPLIGSWYGTYPKFWLNRISYQPLPREMLDLDLEMGQKFLPSNKAEGFNFATMMGTFDDFVTMPGSTWSSTDPTPTPVQGVGQAIAQQDSSQTTSGAPKQITASPVPQNAGQDLNIRVVVEGLHAQNLPGGDTLPATRSARSVSRLVTIGSPPTPDADPKVVKPRNPRPTSAIYYPSTTSAPDAEARTTTTKPRPMSAIIEASTTPPMGQLSEDGKQRKHQRQASDATQLSDDVWLQEDIAAGATSSHKRSHSLRHTKSRDGLVKEYSTPPRGSTKPGPLPAWQRPSPDDEQGIQTAVEALSGTPPRRSATISKVPNFRPAMQSRKLSPSPSVEPSGLLLETSQTSPRKHDLPLRHTSENGSYADEASPRIVSWTSAPPAIAEIPNRFSNSTSTTHSTNIADSPITPSDSYVEVAHEPQRTVKSVQSKSPTTTQPGQILPFEIPPLAPPPPPVGNPHRLPPSAFTTNPINYALNMQQQQLKQNPMNLLPSAALPSTYLPPAAGLPPSVQLPPPERLVSQQEVPPFMSATARDVDSIVQRELEKFIRQNPELVSPASVTGSSPRKSDPAYTSSEPDIPVLKPSQAQVAVMQDSHHAAERTATLRKGGTRTSQSQERNPFSSPVLANRMIEPERGSLGVPVRRERIKLRPESLSRGNSERTDRAEMQGRQERPRSTSRDSRDERGHQRASRSTGGTTGANTEPAAEPTRVEGWGFEYLE